MWYNKSLIDSLKKKIDQIANRFSTENLKEFKDLDAELFNDELNFELEDPDRLEFAMMVHMSVTHISSITQVIAMTILAEGGKGRINNWGRDH